jgi:hypothetical protein
MKQNVIGKTCLSPWSFGSACSYELRGDWIVGKLLGFIPIKRVHMEKVQYLRLATRDELSPLYLLLNWKHFLSNRRTICPIYVLQTGKRQRMFLKLKGDMHFKLRQVIGRKQEKRRQRVAA